MSALKDAWQALHAVATLIDRVERQDKEVEALSADVRDARERLIRIEAIIDFARSQAPRLPR